MGYHALKVPRPGSFDMFFTCFDKVLCKTMFDRRNVTPFDWLTLETVVTFPPYEFVWQSSVLSTALPCCPKSCAHTQERLLLCWHANLSEADLKAALTGTTQRLNKAPDSGKVCQLQVGSLSGNSRGECQHEDVPFRCVCGQVEPQEKTYVASLELLGWKTVQ